MEGGRESCEGWSGENIYWEGGGKEWLECEEEEEDQKVSVNIDNTHKKYGLETT